MIEKMQPHEELGQEDVHGKGNCFGKGFKTAMGFVN